MKYDLILIHPPTFMGFLKEPRLYGPISDSVPSSPAFEMFPMGFATIADYLERRGLRVRILNLPLRMMKRPDMDVEALLSSLSTVAFGIDLHWLVHLRGALEVAAMLKRIHHNTPVILGGVSSTYFHGELIASPSIDFIIRGECAEHTLARLLECMRKRSDPSQIPNLTGKYAGRTFANPLTYFAESLDDFHHDYARLIANSLRDADLAGYTPNDGWMKRPALAVFSQKGCIQNCVTCSGSRKGYRRVYGRTEPIYRSPAALVREVLSACHITKGPVFICGDIRQAGERYAHDVLEGLARRPVPNNIILELSSPAGTHFLKRVGRALRTWTLQLSPETHDEQIRRRFGRNFGNDALERTVHDALAAGARNVKLFFMIGLPGQTAASVTSTVVYCEEFLGKFGPKRVFPFISPLAPFIDPGSDAYEEPEKHGYRRLTSSLEDFKRLFDSLTWVEMLNYETDALTRNEIAHATYEAYIRMTELKARYGQISPDESRRYVERCIQEMTLVDELETLAPECGRSATLSARVGEILASGKPTRLYERGELVWKRGIFGLKLSGVMKNLAGRFLGWRSIGRPR